MTTLPTLYKKTSTGKIQMWEIQAFESGHPSGHPWIRAIYGQVDGKRQQAVDVITEGKNIGKANETTPWEQAEAEAQAQWDKKRKKGYVLDPEQVGTVDSTVIAGGVEPMLAHSYDKQGHKIKFPAFVQPKLDGHRCIAILKDGKASLWSRTRKKITGVPHIERALEQLFPGGTGVVDGELYNHSYREKFEELTSFIRQVTPKPGHEVVQFWVYDYVTDGPFSERKLGLDQLERLGSANCIVPVPTEEVDSEEQMIAVFGAYMSHGFEGLMVRNQDGKYKHGRSYDLQKVKVFADAEFEVTDVTEGRGKMAGKAMFHCVTAEGKDFRVKMMGALDDLAHYLDHKEDYIGKQLTVKYQNLSADGIPRFPVGIRFREDI